MPRVPGERTGRGNLPPREALISALEEHRWNIGATSQALSVSRSTLWRWMRELQLSRSS
jgi:transcriptional regulator of acetoin/glycerol metabolism